jgi:hypothetical protein
MAIRAHELTFGDFGQDGALAESPPHEQTDVADLRCSWQMVHAMAAGGKTFPQSAQGVSRFNATYHAQIS